MREVKELKAILIYLESDVAVLKNMAQAYKSNIYSDYIETRLT
jgi:hypothetical protein